MTQHDLLRRTHHHYSELRRKNAFPDMPNLHFVAVKRACERAEVNEALFDRVAKALDDAVGWARFRSELGWTCCPPSGFVDSGPPVMAEWLDEEGVSHRLIPAPNAVGQALIVTTRDRKLGGNDCPGKHEIPALRQHVEVLGHSRVYPFTHVAYDVYWGLPQDDSPSATRRMFDRFAGFLEQKGG